MAFRDNELIQTLHALEGNPKWSILTEPLWSIPNSLFAPFATLYMRQLGLDDLQIGWILSVGMALQVVFAFISGVITDKLGRRWATVIFDTFSWTLPCLVWAFAQNFTWFLAAAILNAMFQITNNSWTCLFVEDCPPQYVVNAFTLIQITGMLSVFISPLAVWLVGRYSLVPVMRGLYLFAAVSMTAKFLILFRYGGETRQGEVRLRETRGVPVRRLFGDYRGILRQMAASRGTLLVLVFMTLTNISFLPTTNFFSLYVTGELGLSDKLMAVFPMLRTGIMLVFILGIQRLLGKMRLRSSILLGLALFGASHILLLIAPPGGILIVLGYTALEAAAYAVVSPRRDAVMTLLIDPQERSRIYAVLYALIIALSAPFGSFFGWLASLNGAYPFVFNLLVFLVCAGVIFFSRSLREHEEQAAEI